MLLAAGEGRLLVVGMRSGVGKANLRGQGTLKVEDSWEEHNLLREEEEEGIVLLAGCFGMGSGTFRC